MPPAKLRALKPEVIATQLGEQLSPADEIPRHVFFPHHGSLTSIVRSTADGAMVEACVVGSEGVLSVEVVISEPAATGNSIIVQTKGDMTRISVKKARQFFAEDAGFRDRVLAFATNYIHQITQNSVCNRKHEIEPRLAKWLLAVRDRVERDELNLTHEFLSHMLGIHRPGVSIAVNALEVDGLVKHGRNRIMIVDREGLLARACECYAIVSDRLAKLRSTLAP